MSSSGSLRRSKRLFQGRFDRHRWSTSTTQRNYDVMPDDDRFVMIRPADPTKPRTPVILNSFEELKRLVPTSE